MPADGAAAANVTANVSTDFRLGQITTIPEDAQLANATVDASTKTKEQMEAELAALNAETLSQAVEKRRQEFESEVAQIRSQEKAVQGTEHAVTTAVALESQEPVVRPNTSNDPAAASLLMSPQRAATSLLAAEPARPAVETPRSSEPVDARASLAQAVRNDLAFRQALSQSS